MTLHTNLPIYKKGCDLVQLAFHVQQQMPRSFKRTLGEKITGHCTDMLDLMALANATPIEAIAYISGGPLGIVASMIFYRWHYIKPTKTTTAGAKPQ